MAKKIIIVHDPDKLKDWEDAFHGTSFHNLESICKNGLRKEGEIIDEESLSTVDGHIKKGVKFRGIDNWSSAVFVSPSVYYSGHQVYAKEIISEDITWMPVVHVKVAKGSYTEHEHTL